MFGYVICDKPNMLVKDATEYRAYYCGLCKAIGKNYSEKARFLTTYDCTFLAAFLHNLKDKQPNFADETCVLSPVKKKSVCKRDDIFDTVAAVAVLLAGYKLADDVLDEGGLKKRFLKAALGRDVRKAKRKLPVANDIISDGYENLRRLERAGCDSIDETADTFATLLQNLVCHLADSDDYNVKRFCYALGKWIYVMDAVDDVFEDKTKNRFNALLNAFGKDFSSKEQFLERFKDDLSLVLYNCYNEMVAAYNNIKVTVAEGVLSNVVYLGIKAQTEKMLKGENKCNKTRL